jgi:hypothetical protein
MGRSLTDLAPASSRGGRPAQLTARKNKVELSRPAPFSRVVYDRLRDPMGRFPLSEEDLVGMLVAGNDSLRKMYAAAGPGKGKAKATGTPKPPLKVAAGLLNGEVVVLEHDYLGSLQLA